MLIAPRYCEMVSEPSKENTISIFYEQHFKVLFGEQSSPVIPLFCIFKGWLLVVCWLYLVGIPQACNSSVYADDVLKDDANKFEFYIYG